MIKHSKHNNRSVLEMSNGLLTVYIAPELGGRILQIVIDGEELLFENENLKGMANVQGTARWTGTWQNFGGEKLWVAPQGWDSDDEWPGPPCPVIDGGSHKVSIDGDTVSLTSAVQRQIGVSVGRSIRLADGTSRIDIDAWLRNDADHSKRWAIWAVAQVVASSSERGHFKVFFGCDRSKLGYQVIHGVVNSPQWRVRDNIVEVDYQYIAGKIGCNPDNGWACYMNCDKGVCLVSSYDPAEDKEYDMDAPLQVWTQGRGSVYTRGSLSVCPDNMKVNPGYMQVELLSPLQRVRAGESIRHRYSMWACRVHPSSSVVSWGRNWLATSDIAVRRGSVVARLGVAIEGYVAVECCGSVTKVPCGPTAPVDLDVPVSSNDISISLYDSDNNLVERIYRSSRSFDSIFSDGETVECI
ncbi:MAG: hypothetical protein J6K28_00195 [Alistipes sp.]|nr:hypothetical protein [Alistipes sp.]